MFLYDPAKKEKHEYDLPIFDTDNAVSAYTWRYLMDTYVANNGHKVSEKKFREHIHEFIKMIEEDMFDTFDICKTEILKDIANS